MVEEDAAIAVDLSACLQKDGFELRRVGNPEEVAAAVESFKPHVLVLDASPAEGDNISVLRSLRSYSILRQTSTAPLLAIAGGHEDRDRLIKLGLSADDYVSKPFQVQELADSIATLLRHSLIVPPPTLKPPVAVATLTGLTRSKRGNAASAALLISDLNISAAPHELPAGVQKEHICVLVAQVALGGEQSGSHAFKRMGDGLDCARDSVLRFKGRTIRQSGAEIVALFSHADDGANAACDMQEAVSQLTQSPTGTVSLQVGIHAGDIIISGADVFGDALTLATRLANSARPGQILYTSSTFAAEAGTPADRSQLRGDAEVMELAWQTDFTSTLVTNIADTSAGKTLELLVRHRDKRHVVNQQNPVLMIGRDASADIQISHLKASRMHAWLQLREDGFYLIDKSSNGTAVVFDDESEFTILHKQLRLRRKGCFALGQFLDAADEDVVYFEIAG